MKNTVQKIKDYLEQNEEVFNQCIEELDSYNGYLGDNRYYDMGELDDLLQGRNATDLLNMAFFGRDDDTYHTDSHSNKEHGAFNPNRDYFYFNGYGNLVSSDFKDYSYYLDDGLVEDLSENRCYIYAIDDDYDLSILFDELEQDEDESEEAEQ